MKGYVTCPECDCRFPIKLPQKPTKTADVVCLKCGHRWQYEGSLRSRIHCPKCGSTRNKVNRLMRTFVSKNTRTFVQKSWNVISNVSYLGRIERVKGEEKEESEQRD